MSFRGCLRAFRIRIRTLLLLTTALAVGVVVWKPILVAYHYRAMDIVEGRLVSPAQTAGEKADWRRYDSHQRALLRLGYYVERRFTLRHLTYADSRELRDRLRGLSASLSRADQFSTMQDTVMPTTVTVWGRPAVMPRVAAVIESSDVPNPAATRIAPHSADE